eukprot:TRINITY_DN55212_c0_g1_i1.p1 TRINITY_DN55212_c0_g1~~TRINITY_DN55212_c0_g1_i1.p1  ORF type:complete len:1248 (+),score=118.50 TRINITY_DN55212_c0_g1_i1:60-3803(+)
MRNFRDELRSKVAELTMAPEFSDVLEYVALKEFLRAHFFIRSRSKQGSIHDASIKSRGSNKDGERVSVQPSVAWANEADMADLKSTFEEKLLSEAQKIRSRIDAVQSRLDATKTEYEHLEAKVHGPHSFTQQDMQQLLSLQKESDALTLQLHEYKRLNYRGFFKLLKEYDEVPGSRCFARFLPVVFHRLGISSGSPEGSIEKDDSVKVTDRFKKVRQLQLDNIEATFDQVIQSLGEDSEEQRKYIMESRAMITQQCNEVLGSPKYVQRRPQEERPEWWKKFLPPIVGVLLTYGWDDFSKDISAAVVISVAGIPKAMSYASLANLPVVAGIATLYTPCLVYGLLGSSRQVAMSPQSVTCLLLGQMIEETISGANAVDDAGERTIMALLYTFYTGVLIVVFGACNLGFLLNFISRSVLSGFVSASAIIAAVSTVKNLLGLHVKKSPVLYVMVGRLFAVISDSHWPTVAIGAVGITYLFVVPRLQKAAAKRVKSVKASDLTVGVKKHCATAALFLLVVPTVLYVMLFGTMFGCALCNFTPFVDWSLRHVLTLRGATAPASYFEQVNARFRCAHHSDGLSIEYATTGSGDGLKSMMRNGTFKADVGLTDVLPPQDAMDRHALKSFPVLSTFVCVVVNLPILAESPSVHLVFDLATVTAIFQGDIQFWSDPRIHRANPNLPWQALRKDLPITVVTRSDHSGTTAAFSHSILNCSGCIGNSSQAHLLVAWTAPLQLSAESNSGVVRTVASKEGAIGYATYGGVLAASERNAHCSAWLVDNTVIKPARAKKGGATGWPIVVTSYIIVPDYTRDVHVSTGRPRQGECVARDWLNSYLDDTYLHMDIAEDQNAYLHPRPGELDSLQCGGTRLLSATDDSGTDFQCTTPSPTCSGIQVVGYIDSSVPLPRWPRSTISIPWTNVLRNSLLLASVALLEHVANVKLYADRKGYSVCIGSDLVSVGLSNVVGSLFGSFVVAGGFSRSALNENAASQLSLLFSVLISFFVVFVISPLLSMLPDAILNVILFCAVAPLVDVKTIAALVRLGRHAVMDLIALSIAFVATCFLGVVQGMILAVAFSIVEFFYKSISPQITELRRCPGSLHYDTVHFERTAWPANIIKRFWEQESAHTDLELVTPVKVLRFEAPLWFANATRLTDRLTSEIKIAGVRGIVLDCSTMPWMDSTAATLMKAVFAFADERGVYIVIAQSNDVVRYLLESVTGVTEERFFDTAIAAETAADRGDWSMEADPHSPMSSGS